MLAQPPLWLILLAFVTTIGLLVSFHEFGHYIVGRFFGVGAESFSIGFGPEIFGWTDKRGTRWKVAWLPLGGYVRFTGDMNPVSMPEEVSEASAEERARSFHTKPVWQRFLIVLAGPAANFLLAIAIFAAFFAAFGVPSSPSVVAGIEPGTAAAAAGLQAGDRIEAVAGERTPSFEDVQQIVMVRPGEEVPLQIRRGGRISTVQVKLGEQSLADDFGETHRIGLLGVYSSGRELHSVPVLQIVPEAVSYTFGIVGMQVDALSQVLRGNLSTKELGGPLKIAQVAGQRASLGPLSFVEFLALLSINLGFINLLPVPVLDGGHLFFYLVEAVRRRPVSIRFQEWAFRGGMALVLALLLFLAMNDLGSLGLWEKLGRLIG